MKIAIFTFWESRNNYGQLLQAYALQESLSAMGNEVRVVRFMRCGRNSRSLRLLKLKVKKHLRHIVGFKTISEKKLYAFRKNNIRAIGRDYYTYGELEQYPPRADMYMCGSDQVWNWNFETPPDAFLLNFGPTSIKRVSYAASFGHRVMAPDLAEKYKSALSRFDSISVRESDGVTICQALGIHEAEWVPDPTLLFTREEWRSRLNIVNEPKNQVFIYTLGNSHFDSRGDYFNFARKMGSVYHVSANGDASGDQQPGIEEWVSNISNSRYVITNSFHGMVFSIIFRVNFAIVPNSGAAEGMNSRIDSLARKLGLEDRIISTYDTERMQKLYDTPVDWNVVDEKIVNWRECAWQFLKKATSI